MIWHLLFLIATGNCLRKQATTTRPNVVRGIVKTTPWRKPREGNDNPFWEPGEGEKLVVVCPPCPRCGRADQVAIDYGPAADDCLPEYQEYLQKSLTPYHCGRCERLFWGGDFYVRPQVTN